LTTEDIIKNIKKTVPISFTMKEAIEKIREWARNRTVPASKVEAKGLTERERKLEF